MALLRKRQLQVLLQRAKRAKTNQTKGRAWEAIGVYVFSSVPGLSIASTNRLHVLNQHEIDIAMWNDQLPTGLKSLPDVIFVEAKNWYSAVDANAIRAFDSKLNQQGMQFGILLATNGVTGDPADRTAGHGVIATALTQGRRIIVITRADIESLTSTRNLIRLIKQKICELVVAGAVIP
jgi:hypothetical protein